MHGKYPFPEATATTEVLVSGEKGGNQAKLLAVAGLVGGLYDFAVEHLRHLDGSGLDAHLRHGAQVCRRQVQGRALRSTPSAAVLGLGYIIGLKYSARSSPPVRVLIWFLVVPLVGSRSTRPTAGAGISARSS